MHITPAQIVSLDSERYSTLLGAFIQQGADLIPHARQEPAGPAARKLTVGVGFRVRVLGRTQCLGCLGAGAAWVIMYAGVHRHSDSSEPVVAWSLGSWRCHACRASQTTMAARPTCACRAACQRLRPASTALLGLGLGPSRRARAGDAGQRGRAGQAHAPAQRQRAQGASQPAGAGTPHLHGRADCGACPWRLLPSMLLRSCAAQRVQLFRGQCRRQQSCRSEGSWVETPAAEALRVCAACGRAGAAWQPCLLLKGILQDESGGS